MPEPEEKAPKEEKSRLSQNHKYDNLLCQGSNDKVVKNLVKKMGAQQLGVDEINFFRDDNTILHFVRPEGKSILKPQLMPQFRTILSSFRVSHKPKQSKTSSRTSFNNWVPNNINFCNSQSQVSDQQPKMYPTLSKPQTNSTKYNDDSCFGLFLR